MRKGIFLSLAVVLTTLWLWNSIDIFGWSDVVSIGRVLFGLTGLLLVAYLFAISLAKESEEVKEATSKRCDACGHRIMREEDFVHIHNTDMDYCEDCWQGKVKRENILSGNK